MSRQLATESLERHWPPSLKCPQVNSALLTITTESSGGMQLHHPWTNGGAAEQKASNQANFTLH